MPDNYNSYVEAARGRQQYSDTSLDSGFIQSLPPTTESLASAYSIMGSGAGFAGPNSSAYAGALQTMQSTYGNRALQRYLNQPHGQGMAGYAGGAADQGTSTISGLGGSFITPGQTVGGGARLPDDAEGGFGFWENNPSQGIIPGLPFGVPIPDFAAGFGIGYHGFGDMTLLGGGVDFGKWDQDGGTRYGGRGNIGAVDLSIDMEQEQKDHPWLDAVTPDALKEVDWQVLSGNAELSAGNNGFSAGAGITGVGASATFGEFTDNSDTTEQTTRFGLGIGAGVGGRLHWGDSDGDGYGEYGYGVDAGPVSFDLKTEDPLRTLVTGGPFNPLNWVPDEYNPIPQILPEYNMTEATMNWAGSTMSSVNESVLDFVDSSEEWLMPSGGLDPIPSAQSESTGGLGSLFSW